MWTNYFGKIILVSLVRPGNDRTAIAEQQLKKFNIPYTVFPAIEMSNGANGLKHTMYGLLYRYQFSGNILVFEDDVDFITDPGNIMEKCIEQLIHTNWDLFYLGANTHQPFEKFAAPNLLPLKKGLSTHAVAYSGAGIQKVLAAMAGNLNADIAYDQLICDSVQNHGECYASYPMLATQKNGFSAIENAEVDYSFIQQRFEQNVKGLTHLNN